MQTRIKWGPRKAYDALRDIEHTYRFKLTPEAYNEVLKIAGGMYANVDYISIRDCAFEVVKRHKEREQAIEAEVQRRIHAAKGTLTLLKPSNTIITGDAVKSLGAGRVGGYLVKFGSPNERDLDGEYFTAKTYYGPNDGNGVDVYIHHAVPLAKGFEELADRVIGQLKVTRDQLGLFAETVLNLSDEYHKLIHQLVQQGKFGWSSGTAGHLARKSKDGEILRWPIIEGSLTPTPANPRSTASAI